MILSIRLICLYFFSCVSPSLEYSRAWLRVTLILFYIYIYEQRDALLLRVEGCERQIHELSFERNQLRDLLDRKSDELGQAMRTEIESMNEQLRCLQRESDSLRFDKRQLVTDTELLRERISSIERQRAEEKAHAKQDLDEALQRLRESNQQREATLGQSRQDFQQVCLECRIWSFPFFLSFPSLLINFHQLVVFLLLLLS